MCIKEAVVLAHPEFWDDVWHLRRVWFSSYHQETRESAKNCEITQKYVKVLFLTEWELSGTGKTSCHFFPPRERCQIFNDDLKSGTFWPWHATLVRVGSCGLMASCLWKGLALTWTSPGHCDPLSQGETGVLHGRWVIAVDDAVQIKNWDWRK